MFETAKRYSYPKYYTRSELKAYFSSSLDTVYNEIIEYRSLFMIHYFNLNLCMLPEIMRKMLECDELNHLLSYEINSEDECFKDMILKQEYDITKLLNGYVHEQLLKFYDDYNVSIWEKLFFTMYLHSEYKGKIIKSLLFSNHMGYLYSFMMKYMKEVEMFQLMKDVSVEYFHFIEKIHLHLNHTMLSLKSKSDNPVGLNLEELIKRYPMLSETQLRFYVLHREINHFYTINDYRKECDVCYETARYSLEQMVEFEWYMKCKIGKKFVYKIKEK